MRKLLLSLICFCSLAQSQVPDSLLAFFPNQNGNLWIYEYQALWMTNGHLYYYSVEILGDSMFASGKSYKKFLNKNWSAGDTTVFFRRLDSLTANIYSPTTHTTEWRVDSLNSGQSFPDTVLGLATASVRPSTLIGSGRKYSYGLGLTYSWEEISGFPYASILRYARINGTAYGNPLAVPTNAQLPKSISLSQNYPNPFNPETAISFSLNHSAHVTLSVFNLLGQQVAILLNSRVSSGVHVVRFDAGALPAGVYFYRLQTEGVVLTKRMILLN